MTTEMSPHKGQDPSTPGRGDPASPPDDGTLRSNMGRSSRQPQSYSVNRAKVIVKVKVANEDKRI